MTDALTMLGRTVLHTRRNPGALIMTIGLPVVLLLLFTGVFAGALSGTTGRYVDYLVPGILVMSAGYGATTTAMAVNRDMTSGIIARFRTMPISRVSVLTGHVTGSVLRGLVSVVLVLGVAVVLGFRPAAGPADWPVVLALLALFMLALTWLAVAVGLAARTAEGIAPFTLVVQVLPFLSSAFVPPESMSGPIRWFAAHEPFTPILDTVRALLLGGPVTDGGVAVAWCVVLGLAGYVWAWVLFRRDPVR